MKIQNSEFGIIKKRYKRFLADVELNGEIITVYVPNTGSMKTCWEPEQKVLLVKSENKKRKYIYTLEMTKNLTSWVGINTSRTNSLVEEALNNKVIKELEFTSFQKEVTIGKSRLDFLLKDKHGFPNHYLEVKNVTLNINGVAKFPDSISTRGQKHLKELMSIVSSGQKATLLFVVQREDVCSFDLKDSLDPQYSKLLSEAINNGVQVLAYQCLVRPEEIKISHPLGFH
jgi:sugar fermentation stimulation protein A